MIKSHFLHLSAVWRLQLSWARDIRVRGGDMKQYRFSWPQLEPVPWLFLTSQCAQTYIYLVSLRWYFQSGLRKFYKHQTCQCIVPSRGWVRYMTFRTAKSETKALQDALYGDEGNLIEERMSLFRGHYLGHYMIQKLRRVKK